jgi:cytochrome c oxidase assembly protein subunit 20
MADDTRKDGKASEPQYESRSIEEPHYIAPETPRPKRKKPMHAYPETQAGKMWKALQTEEPVNTMPGGMVNTAGGRPKEVSWRDAFNFGEGSFLGDLSKIPKTPCARDSLLVGIAAGGGLGGTSFVLTGKTSVGSHTTYSLTGNRHAQALTIMSYSGGSLSRRLSRKLLLVR